MKTPEQIEKEKALQKSIEGAQRELEALNKSEKEEVDGISELEKALAEFDALSKSEKEEKGEEEDEKEEKEEKGEKEEKEEKMEKSLEDDLSELIEASRLYAELAKSVTDFGAGTGAELAKLNARIDQLAGLITGIGQGVITLSKSMKEIAAQPAKAFPGSFETNTQKTTGGTSKADAIAILSKAIQDDEDPDVNPAWLGKVSSLWKSQGAHCLEIIPADVRTKLGIELPA